MRKIIFALFLLTTFGCADPIVFSGTITNKSMEEIPDNARVLIVWDESKIYGEGTIDHINNTFEISLDNHPPPGVETNCEELNHSDRIYGAKCGFSVGNIIITTNQNMNYFYPWNCADIIGIAGTKAIIYKNENLVGTQIPFAYGWAYHFPAGYSVAQGSSIGEDELFHLADNPSIVITIDELEDIYFYGAYYVCRTYGPYDPLW